MIHKVITVDFDETLFIRRLGTTVRLAPIARIHDWCIERAAEGSELHVVTYRKEDETDECRELIKAYELPIKSVVATSGDSKTPFIKALGATLHVDDMIEVLVSASRLGIECLLVDHEWNRVEKNSTAALFNRI